MSKFLAILAVVAMVAVSGPAVAQPQTVITSEPAPQIGWNCSLHTVKARHGLFGFLGTDRGWFVTQENPVTHEQKIIASGSGTFDGSGIMAMVGGGLALGGMNVLAASSIRPTRVNANIAQSASSSATQSQSQAQGQFQIQNQTQRQSLFGR
jgi:hypothetical protein